MPLDQVPELLCALGFFPTQADVTDMLAALAHAAARRGEDKPADVDFPTLLSLYHNFRPSGAVRCHSVYRAYQHCASLVDVLAT